MSVFILNQTENEIHRINYVEPNQNLINEGGNIFIPIKNKVLIDKYNRFIQSKCQVELISRNSLGYLSLPL